MYTGTKLTMNRKLRCRLASSQSWLHTLFHVTLHRKNVSNLFFAGGCVWLSVLLYCYLYLTTSCTMVTLFCPTPTISFTAKACCSSLWLHLGSPVGLGNECKIDMGDMEAQCPMYDCYRNKSVYLIIN